jgi:hypothetical protein
MTPSRGYELTPDFYNLLNRKMAMHPANTDGVHHLRIDSSTLIPLLTKSLAEGPVRVPVGNVANVQDVYSPAATPDSDQRAAHSAGLVYGLTAAGRSHLLDGDFANSRAAKQITTMGQVLEAARMLEAGGKVSDAGTSQLIKQLASGLEEVGKRLDKVDIDNQTGFYIAKKAEASEALVDAAKAAEKTTMKLARKLGGDLLLAAIAEKHVVPATLKRIEANFPGLFKDREWNGTEEFNVDGFLQREQMDSLHAKIQHGLASDSFLGLQQALNNLVKVPAMVLKQADPEQPVTEDNKPTVQQPKMQPPRSFPPQAPGLGAGNVNQSWAEGGKVGDITIRNPVHDTGSHDTVVLEALSLTKAAMNAALLAKDETIRAKDDMIALLLGKLQDMSSALIGVSNVKSGPGSVDSGCGGDDERGRADMASGPEAPVADTPEPSMPPSSSLHPTANLRERVLRERGDLDRENALQNELKSRLRPIDSTQDHPHLDRSGSQGSHVANLLPHLLKPEGANRRPPKEDQLPPFLNQREEISAKAAAVRARYDDQELSTIAGDGSSVENRLGNEGRTGPVSAAENGTLLTVISNDKNLTGDLGVSMEYQAPPGNSPRYETHDLGSDAWSAVSSSEYGMFGEINRRVVTDFDDEDVSGNDNGMRSPYASKLPSDAATVEKLKSFQDRLLAGTSWRGPDGDLVPSLLTRAKTWPKECLLRIHSISPGAAGDGVWLNYGARETSAMALVRLQNEHYTPYVQGIPIDVKGDGNCFPHAIVKALRVDHLARLLGVSETDCARLDDDQKAKGVALVMAESLMDNLEEFAPYLAEDPPAPKAVGRSYVLSTASGQTSSLALAKQIMRRADTSMPTNKPVPMSEIPRTTVMPPPPPPPIQPPAVVPKPMTATTAEVTALKKTRSNSTDQTTSVASAQPEDARSRLLEEIRTKASVMAAQRKAEAAKTGTH